MKLSKITTALQFGVLPPDVVKISDTEFTFVASIEVQTVDQFDLAGTTETITRTHNADQHVTVPFVDLTQADAFKTAFLAGTTATVDMIGTTIRENSISAESYTLTF